jgi:hypothetical protein
MVNQVFGLRKWPLSNRWGTRVIFVELIKSVPMRKRDTRLVGRSGSSQLILSNPDLENLMVEVLTVIVLTRRCTDNKTVGFIEDSIAGL